MYVRHLCIVLLVAAQATLAQDCAAWGDKKASLQFLLDNKAHSTDADPRCVNIAFSTLSRDPSYAETLAGLLDFERFTKNDDFKTRGGKYPALGALMTIGKPAIPFLIKAIKQSDSELVRTNAAEVLGAIHRPCVRGIMAMLDAEVAKTRTTSEQQRRLLAAKDCIGNFYPLCGSEKPAQ